MIITWRTPSLQYLSRRALKETRSLDNANIQGLFQHACQIKWRSRFFFLPPKCLDRLIMAMGSDYLDCDIREPCSTINTRCAILNSIWGSNFVPGQFYQGLSLGDSYLRYYNEQLCYRQPAKCIRWLEWEMRLRS